jgi:hypothetical protein
MTTTQTSPTTSDTGAFWGAMNREVGTIHAERNLGENGADQYSMYGLAGQSASQVQGAFVAAFAGMTRGCTRERVGEFFRNIETTAKQNSNPKAFQNAMATVCVLAFQTRDCRGTGKGERDLSRWLLLELYQRFPRTVEALAPLFPEYGYWKDLSLFIQDCSTEATVSVGSGIRKRARTKVEYQPLVDQLYENWARQLEQDLQTLVDADHGAPTEEKPKLSLAAKYVPKEGRSFDRKFGCAKRLAQLLYPEQFRVDFRSAMRVYRQNITRINRAINTTETLMSATPPQWDRINFQLVPGCLLRRCRRAFLNLQGGSKCRENEARSKERTRVQCAKNLERHLDLAKQGKVKVKGRQNFLHQIVESHLISEAYSAQVDPNLNQAEMDLLQLQWNDHRDSLRDKITSQGLKVDRGVSLIDVSGSMAGTPMIVAVTLGLMVSELAPAPYGNRFLTFEDQPQWCEFEADWPLSRKISHALKAPWGGTTDFMAAMDLMLGVAVKNKLTPDQIPEWFLVASDMQFNSANGSFTGSSRYPTVGRFATVTSGHGRSPQWKTHHDILVESFRAAGLHACGQPYTLPRMIYWNLRGDTVGFPVQADTPNCQMLSGFSTDLLTLVLEQRVDDYEEKAPPTPWDTFVKAMDNERYDPVLEVVQRVGEGCLRGYTAPVRVSDDIDICDTDSTDSSMPDLVYDEEPESAILSEPPTPPSGEPHSDWNADQVSSWFRQIIRCGNDIALAVIREQVDGGAMGVIVQESDRESLVELGVTSRLQQARLISQWKASSHT